MSLPIARMTGEMKLAHVIHDILRRRKDEWMANDCHVLAADLLMLTRKIAPDVAKMEAIKEQLRAKAIADGIGYREDFGDKGSVEVSKGTEREFKGLFPVLDAAKFLALPKGRQLRMQDDELIKMEHKYSSAARPSVTVRI